MLTRCPSCDTHFRVTSQQIKARAGMVRCGACHNVFNALATLVDEPVATEDPVVADVHNPVTEARHPTEEELELDMVAALTSELEALRNEANETFTSETDDATGAEDDVGDDTIWQIDAPADEPPASDYVTAPEPLATPDGVDEYAEQASDELPGEFTDEPFSAASSNSATAPLPDTPDELADYLASPLVPATTAPQRSWPWLLGSGMALLLLLVQLVYYFRVDIGTLRPEWRGHLLAACEPFNCKVPRPRHIDTIGIEASDLRPDPQQPGHLTLKAELRSQAAYAQEWPLLELTLTDVNDQKIAVKHFAARDYLPKKGNVTQTLAAGFPARGEISVALPLDVGYLAAAGYRLYVFYP